MDWDAKRVLMNKLYAAAVKLRAAQQKYFKSRDHRDLVASRVIEADFDKLLINIRLQAKGQPVLQPHTIYFQPS